MTEQAQLVESGAPLTEGDMEALSNVKKASATIRAQLAKVIVGQHEVIDQLLLAIFSQGHCLLEGVPGLAKTLMVSTLARSLHLSFSRIQFTPDLMPSDITGTEVIQEDKATGSRVFKFLQGPVFSNIILADEINRTPPKTQAALLEAMQEKQVTIGGDRHPLPAPFFVLATQNPIEQEGTYTLPEAQQDRFMFKVFVSYPSYEDEYRVAELTTAPFNPQVEAVLSAAEIVELQSIVRRAPVAPHVIHYALRLARSTRVQEPDAPSFVKEWVSWGAGPRGVQYLLLGGKARAVLDGRYFVTTDDIKAVAHPVLRHRVITNFNAESEGVTPDRVVDRLLQTISDKQADRPVPPQVARAFGAQEQAMALQDFWMNVRTGVSMLVPGPTVDAPTVDAAAIERALAASVSWLSPRTVEGFDPADFGFLTDAQRQELTSLVNRLRKITDDLHPIAPPSDAVVKRALPLFRDIVAMFEFHRYGGAEAFRIGKKIERKIEPYRPAELAELRFNTGPDHSGDPAIWIWAIITDEGAEESVFRATATTIRSLLEAVSRMIAPDLLSYVRFRTLSEQAEITHAAAP